MPSKIAVDVAVAASAAAPNSAAPKSPRDDEVAGAAMAALVGTTTPMSGASIADAGAVDLLLSGSARRRAHAGAEKADRKRHRRRGKRSDRIV